MDHSKYSDLMILLDEFLELRDRFEELYFNGPRIAKYQEDFFAYQEKRREYHQHLKEYNEKYLQK